MAFHLLKILSVGVVATLILFTLEAVPCLAADLENLPTKAHPLVIDLTKRQVLLYTEINLKNRDKTNPHWGVVYRGGKLRDKAILSAFCPPEEFHEALIKIGARPGNNLTGDQTGTLVEGDELTISTFRPDLNKSFPLTDILFDQAGKGFQIRFGGNLERAVKEKTGCITCLESCPLGITSNAAYPTISSWKRFFSPNSLFKGKKENLPTREGAPVILIYQRLTRTSRNLKMQILEFMATALQIPLESFGDVALRGDKRIQISSMCTVFAESEATSLMARGERPENIALGLHLAIVQRPLSMLGRVGKEEPLVFAGGVAHNPCVRKLVKEGLNFSPSIPENPDMVGAIGAALYGIN